MARIDRYILTQLIGAFGLFALILVSIYWLNRAIRIFGRLIADGQGTSIFLEIIALTLPYVVMLVQPVAVLAASLWVTNRLTAESERVVIEAAGASGWRLARPYVLFGLLVCLLVGVLGHWLVPLSRAQLSAKRDTISQDIAARLIVPGMFIHPAPGTTLFIREISPSGEMKNLFLYESQAPGRSRSYVAERALIIDEGPAPVLVMFDGLLQTTEPPDRHLSTVRFREFAYDLSPLMASRAERTVPLREVDSLALIVQPPGLQAATEASAQAMWAELHRRISQTIAPLLYSLLGLAALLIGRFSRFGSWRQVVLAIISALALASLGSRAEDAVKDAPNLWPLLYAQALAGAALIGLLILFAARPGLWPPGTRGMQRS